jgi:hypothetical protein
MSIQGNDGFLDLENASLRVTGNVHAEGLKVGSVRLQSAATLQSTTVSGNTTTQMVQFTNPTKGFDVTSNIEVGDANLFVDTTTGRVGVGTNAPMGTLDVKGVLNHTQVANVAQITSNSNVVMEYKLSTRDYETKEPRIALTANSDRGYVASASSNNSGFDPGYKLFNHNVGDYWHTDYPLYSTTSPYTYTGGNTLSTYNGEWVTIDLNQNIKLCNVSLYNRNGLINHASSQFVILGSSDNLNWNLLSSVTGTSWTNSLPNNIIVNSEQYYRYYGFVFTHGNGSTNIALGEIKLYGTPFTANVAHWHRRGPPHHP